MTRRTRKATLRRKHHKKSMRKHLRHQKRGGMNVYQGDYNHLAGGMQDYEREYSEFAGGMRDTDPRCAPAGQPNNRNNLPYFPYVSRGNLNSGFQYGDILMKEGGKKRRLRQSKKSKRGGGCGGQANESWFRGAYPVLLV